VNHTLPILLIVNMTLRGFMLKSPLMSRRFMMVITSRLFPAAISKTNMPLQVEFYTHCDALSSSLT
jgi:hypothetical protein